MTWAYNRIRFLILWPFKNYIYILILKTEKKAFLTNSVFAFVFFSGTGEVASSPNKNMLNELIIKRLKDNEADCLIVSSWNYPEMLLKLYCPKPIK